MIPNYEKLILGEPAVALEGVEEGRKALIVGNGPSRNTIDLRAARAAGWLIYACNWFYREEGQVMPDYIGAVDKKPSISILEDRLCATIPVILRAPCIRRYVMRAQAKQSEPAVFEDASQRILLYEWHKPFPVFSGPMMIGIALLCGCDPIVLVGFDGGPKYNVTENQIKAVMDIKPGNVYRIGGDWLDFIPPYASSQPSADQL